MFKVLHSTVEIAHNYLAECLKPGGIAIDATIGNGRDTLFMAGLVGENGRIYGFDIQEGAIETTRKLLDQHGYLQNVTLIIDGHEKLKQYVLEPVNAIIFNLGYLPGGNQKIVTTPETTLIAVSDGLNILKPGGIMCIVLYTGHPGGVQEQLLIEEYLKKLEKKEYYVGKLDFINRDNAPYLIVIERSF